MGIAILSIIVVFYVIDDRIKKNLQSS
jgi:hypothetical protein